MHIPSNPAHINRLPNGLMVAVLERPSVHQVLVTLMARVGSRHEPARQSGITHLLEHMIFRGNSTYANAEAMALAFEECGSMLNAQTGPETTEFFFTAHPDKLPQGLDALARFIRHPTFDDLDKERRVILEELQYDYNDQGRLISLPALGVQLLWPGHPLGQQIGGTPDTVEGLTLDQLRVHYAHYCSPGNMVLSLTGRITAEQGLALATQAFGDWPAAEGPALDVSSGISVQDHAPGSEITPSASPSPPAPLALSAPPAPAAPPAPVPRLNGPHVLAVPDADNQFHLALNFIGPGYNDPDELAMELLVRTLDDGPGSRLQRIIREELALVYHIGSDHFRCWDTGALEITTSVRSEQFPTLLEKLLSVLADFRDEGPTQAELTHAKTRCLFDLEFSRDSLSAHEDRYVWPLMYSRVRSEAEEAAIIQGIQLEHLGELAKKVLQRENLHLVLVGPLEDNTNKLLQKLVENY